MILTMDDSASFYVTLPSNASAKVYPQNVNGHYRTRLERRLTLAPGEWEVALTSMTYTNSWINVTTGRVQYKDLGDTSGDSPKTVDYNIPTGKYSNIVQVLEAVRLLTMNHSIRDLVSILYSPIVNKVRTRVIRESATLSLSDDLNEILGFRQGEVIGYPGLISRYPCDISRGMTGLFVYSDVIENRMVGDTRVLLLRIVPVKGQSYDNVSQDFAYPQYHRVANYDNRDISIKVARDTGETIVFPSGKVSVVLHFRKN